MLVEEADAALPWSAGCRLPAKGLLFPRVGYLYPTCCRVLALLVLQSSQLLITPEARAERNNLD